MVDVRPLGFQDLAFAKLCGRNPPPVMFVHPDVIEAALTPEECAECRADGRLRWNEGGYWELWREPNPPPGRG